MRNKQLMIELNNNEVMLSAGAMQYMIGNIEMTSGIKGVGGTDAQYAIRGGNRNQRSQTALQGNRNHPAGDHLQLPLAD
ncbi:hypothetical protein ACFSQ7_02585 [Paenibacillus rhizoplanae]